jgi:hypothetical protein
MRFEVIQIIFSLLNYYIFNKDKAKRKLFWRSIRKGLGKSMLMFPWIVELLLYFKAENEFLSSHFPDTPWSLDQQEISSSAMSAVDTVVQVQV